MIVGEGQVEEMLKKVRSDPDLASHVESYLQFLSATLAEPGAIDSDAVFQAFLAQWNARARPN
jgi:hypothetical protein